MTYFLVEASYTFEKIYKKKPDLSNLRVSAVSATQLSGKRIIRKVALCDSLAFPRLRRGSEWVLSMCHLSEDSFFGLENGKVVNVQEEVSAVASMSFGAQ